MCAWSAKQAAAGQCAMIVGSPGLSRRSTSSGRLPSSTRAIGLRRTDHQWELPMAAAVCMLLNHIALALPPPSWAVLGSAIGSVSFPAFSLLDCVSSSP